MVMFGNQPFYNAVIRKYIIMFGNMFNDVQISRMTKEGVERQRLIVPISYGPKEKYLARLNDDKFLERQVATVLPRLAFEITSMQYAPTRTTNKLLRNVATGTNANTLVSQFTPVPYDFNISLYGMFANQEDAVQVVEQVLPFFRPEWTTSVKLIDELDQYFDIPTTLTDLTIEDSYDSDYESRRSIIYTFNFIVKGYVFGPLKNKGVINRTLVDISADSVIGTARSVGMDLTPGQLSDGSPTANTDASVDYKTISADSTYGYAFDNEDFFTGE
jgi:hypothetical protein